MQWNDANASQTNVANDETKQKKLQWRTHQEGGTGVGGGGEQEGTMANVQQCSESVNQQDR